MTQNGYLSNKLSVKTTLFGLKLWVILGIGVGTFIALILFVLSLWLASRNKSRRIDKKVPLPIIPNVSKEIQEVKSDKIGDLPSSPSGDLGYLDLIPTAQKAPTRSRYEGFSGALTNGHKEFNLQEKRYQKTPGNSETECIATNGSHIGNIVEVRSGNYEKAVRQLLRKESSVGSRSADSVVSIAEISHLGWGQWYDLNELEAATDNFSDKNVIGEGGYGIVYKGRLMDGTLVAVKNLLNNRGQAEKEFKVEVEAIGRVRHKNLVRLLGYCAEGNYRMLVYEYVGNGNLEQWLHESVALSHAFSWELRMKIVLGTAKALAYLHEALEPKVVHRDIKSSNILIDSEWNPKVSDFGLAKLLGSGESHLTTRVMGTFGYVAPEYANTGLLNEKSDVYSFGVLLMEIITGRDPVNYGRPPEEVNLVDWLKSMVVSRRFDDVADPSLDMKPSSRTLKRALLIALRCVDPDSNKRPKMGLVAHMLEAEDFPFRDELRISRNMDRVKQKDTPSQEKMLQSLSKEIDLESGHGSRPFKKKWRRYEG
ncbi:hypothetical protein O6H91_03G096600 [Diphasiastrum complanatum]|uniref:Uncharacterized protein n=4 Tax=Diphasiastrum complanatum TaxID=34168 RepID=A0ACC2E9L5_DIPCM|nr:hypothetical protein O6H91_03G096600 [Diphasiastrum complanatum]KAJ7563105.1 hypothetical protein O6H91_03G096600 [Diphasiastrum complanatum]KAJ7563106.1 hypothetical protein O6H91_03G096600 [Diphasiastrum complanatum]KAJ7563107.1 hypothetical protein O6H91_03G096600 [Diphasiastrum complanatum]